MSLPICGDTHALLSQLEKSGAEFGLVASSPSLPENVRLENQEDIQRVMVRVRLAVNTGAREKSL
jgi:hypothetical protein